MAGWAPWKELATSSLRKNCICVKKEDLTPGICLLALKVPEFCLYGDNVFNTD
jgi:hypothetical protein